MIGRELIPTHTLESSIPLQNQKTGYELENTIIIILIAMMSNQYLIVMINNVIESADLKHYGNEKIIKFRY